MKKKESATHNQGENQLVKRKIQITYMMGACQVVRRQIKGAPKGQVRDILNNKI